MLDWGAGDAGDEGEAEEAGGGRGGTELHCLSIGMQREQSERRTAVRRASSILET